MDKIFILNVFSNFLEFLQDLDPRISAAIIAAALSALVSIVNIRISLRRFRIESALSEKTDYIAKKILKDHPTPFVSIGVMSHFLGGYSELEVRRILLRVGAVRMRDENGFEVWSLYNRLPRHARKQIMKFTPQAVDDPPKSRLFADEILPKE